MRAYEAAARVTCNFAITLKKTIPHGAGLGGGSSDAATTLLGLDQLHGDKLGATRLRAIAAILGSDVPFFLTPGAARCTGRGEIITPCPTPPAMRVLLLKPAFAVATPDAYRRWSDSQEIPGIPYGPQELCRPRADQRSRTTGLRETPLPRRTQTMVAGPPGNHRSPALRLRLHRFRRVARGCRCRRPRAAAPATNSIPGSGTGSAKQGREPRLPATLCPGKIATNHCAHIGTMLPVSASLGGKS